MDSLYEFIIELDKLKTVNRRSYIAGNTRFENSAEHSWQLAVAVLTLQEKFDLDIDLVHALKLALVHDICEIDGGDVPVFDPNYANKSAAEKQCMQRLAKYQEPFAQQIAELWHEYETQETPESQWVHVLDRLLPFMLNMHNEGRVWREMNVCATQVKDINAFIQLISPEIHAWMMMKVEEAIEAGWLINK